MRLETNFPFERRKENRIPFVVSVREHSNEGIVLCLSTNISSNGMAIKRASDLYPPNKITIEFAIPDTGDIIKIPAKFLRGHFNQEIQEGVVIFEEIPKVFQNWFKKLKSQNFTYIT